MQSVRKLLVFPLMALMLARRRRSPASSIVVTPSRIGDDGRRRRQRNRTPIAPPCMKRWPVRKCRRWRRSSASISPAPTAAVDTMSGARTRQGRERRTAGQRATRRRRVDRRDLDDDDHHHPAAGHHPHRRVEVARRSTAVRFMIATLTAALSLAASLAIDVPYLPQTDALCGGAAAAMVFRYWGDAHADAQSFAPLVDRDAGGIANGVLTAAIQARGWQHGDASPARWTSLRASCGDGAGDRAPARSRRSLSLRRRHRRERRRGSSSTIRHGGHHERFARRTSSASGSAAGFWSLVMHLRLRPPLVHASFTLRSRAKRAARPYDLRSNRGRRRRAATRGSIARSTRFALAASITPTRCWTTCAPQCPGAAGPRARAERRALRTASLERRRVARTRSAAPRSGRRVRARRARLQPVHAARRARRAARLESDRQAARQPRPNRRAASHALSDDGGGDGPAAEHAADGGALRSRETASRRAPGSRGDAARGHARSRRIRHG